MTDQEKLEQYFLARLMYWRSAIMGLEDSAVEAVVATLEAVKREIGELLFEELAGLASVTDWNMERMAALEAFCDEVLAGARAATTGTINESMLAAASASLQNYNAMLSLDGLAVSVSSVAMSAEQIKSWFQTTPLGGRLLGDWVERAFSKGVKQSIIQSLRQSAVKGQGTASMVKKLLQTAIDDGFSITRREAITLARTYTQTANVEAQMAVYKKNEDLIYAYKWLSILDTSVCPRCGALDGKIYKKDEKRPPMPLHPRCRCLWQAMMRIEELGISSEDLDQVARPWVRRELKNIDEGGKRKLLEAGSTKENFGQWWHTLSDKEQEYSVGKTRARLLREGKVKFEDLVDKSTGRLRPLEDLGFDRPSLRQVFGLPPKNESFIEKLTGASGGTPESILKNAEAVNPRFNEGGGYERNCQRCVSAYEMRRRGHNVEAMPNPYKNRSGTSARENFAGYECFKNPDVKGLFGFKPFLDSVQLEKELQDLPEGARACILWAWSDKKRSHAIICEKISGRMIFADPQNGKTGPNVLGKASTEIGYSYFRMDNLEADENFEWEEIIKKSGK